MALLKSARTVPKDTQRGALLEARARKRITSRMEQLALIPAGSGSGDMLKATYDTDGDNYVEKFRTEYYGVTALPTANAGNRGRMIETKAAGQPGKINYCITNSSGGYEWIIIGQSAT